MNTTFKFYNNIKALVMSNFVLGGNGSGTMMPISVTSSISRSSFA